MIDSDRLRSDPDRVIGEWCARVGIEHRPESLHWAPGMRPEWQLWRSWYENAAASTGFAPPDLDRPDLHRPDRERPARVVAVLPAAIAAVETLRQHAIA